MCHPQPPPAAATPCRRRLYSSPIYSHSAQSVCPGDVLMALPETGVVRIGGGVQQEGEQLVAVKAGVLQRAPKGGKLWVEARQKR